MPRLLLVAPNWFGDALLATPLLRALRERLPDARVTVLCVPRVANLFRRHPRVDEVIVYDEGGRDRWPWALARLVGRLRRGRFDAALVLRPSRSRTWLLWAAGIPRRIGHAAPGKDRWLTERMAPAGAPEHRADTYLRLLTAWGWSVPSDAACEFPIRDEDRALICQWLHAQGVMNDEPLVVLHPGGNWAHKRWPPERFAAVADHLHEAYGAHIVLTGAAEDWTIARAVGQAMRAAPLISIGETSWLHLGALFERADLIVVNDTSPLHIAAALQRPFIALFGPTSPVITGPYHAASGVVLWHPECCPRIPCYAPEHPPHAGMAAIAVEEVVHAAEALLRRAARSVEPTRHG